MPTRRHVGLAAAFVSSTVLGAALPGFAAQADPTTLYVNSAAGICSVSGPGSEAQPFCTVQAAADAAQPGQTVQIAPGSYPEQVTVTRSGTEGHPITFKGAANYTQATAVVGVHPSNANAPTRSRAFVLSGVHDVVVTGLRLQALQEAVLVSDADRITVDANSLRPIGFAAPRAVPGIRLTGRTTDSKVSRNFVYKGQSGIAVDAGVTGAVVTTNLVTLKGAGITVTDAPGTVLAGNTVSADCGVPVVLAGNSANSVIVNNVLSSDSDGELCPTQPDLTVSAASVSGTRADYNVVSFGPGKTNYAWGGSTYTSPAAFTTATGRGGHDVAGAEYDLSEPMPAAVDSADATAPGMPATDILGKSRIDDPLVANTGTGAGTVDRGAVELQDRLSSSVQGRPSQELWRLLDVNITARANEAWGPVTGTLDFGDGSPKAAVTDWAQVTHTYPSSGTYTLTYTVTDGVVTSTSTSTVTLDPIGPIKPVVSSWQQDWSVPRTSLNVYAESPWPITKFTLDFGDGSPKVTAPGPYSPDAFVHTFPGSGTYQVVATVTDDHGRTATRTEPLQVGKLLPLNRTIEAVKYGRVTEMYNDGGVWHDSGLVIGASSSLIPASALAFTYSPSGARVIEAVENGVLHEIYSAPDGWHDAPIVGAGANITALSFAYSPSGARVIEAIENGVLHEIYSAPDGWHDNPIEGVAPNVTAMSFAYNAAGQRVIQAIENGVLHEIYSAADGWHDNPIEGVAPNVTALSFAYNPAGQRVIAAVENGVLHEIRSAADGWHDTPIPGAGTDIKSLSLKVRPTGDRVIEAVEGNTLHEIYTNAGTWYDSATPINGGDLTSISLNLR
ncbi:PKD domain-containing protein [Kitasatospora sp. NPDC002040]|uniref:PKD domain-containing protein n=1 Tax=Kitasatospora sp. NPDC002040 TaxID=3154661 RepID=UPI0033238FC2